MAAPDGGRDGQAPPDTDGPRANAPMSWESVLLTPDTGSFAQTLARRHGGPPDGQLRQPWCDTTKPGGMVCPSRKRPSALAGISCS
jgi:hypothetical protein